MTAPAWEWRDTDSGCESTAADERGSVRALIRHSWSGHVIIRMATSWPTVSGYIEVPEHSGRSAAEALGEVLLSAMEADRERVMAELDRQIATREVVP